MCTREEFDLFRRNFQAYFPAFHAYLERIGPGMHETVFDGWYRALQAFTIDDMNDVTEAILCGDEPRLQPTEYPDWGFHIRKRVLAVLEKHRRKDEREEMSQNTKRRRSFDPVEARLRHGMVVASRACAYCRENDWSEYRIDQVLGAIAVLADKHSPEEEQQSLDVLEHYGVRELYESEWSKQETKQDFRPFQDI